MLESVSAAPSGRRGRSVVCRLVMSRSWLLVSMLSKAASSFPGVFPSKTAARAGSVEMSQQDFSCFSFYPSSSLTSWRWCDTRKVLTVPWKQGMLSSCQSTQFPREKAKPWDLYPP